MADLALQTSAGPPITFEPALVAGSYARLEGYTIGLEPDPDDVAAAGLLYSSAGDPIENTSAAWFPMGAPAPPSSYRWRFVWDLTETPAFELAATIALTWSADGFDPMTAAITVPAAPAEVLYGATVGDVRNHLAHRTFEPGSRPTAGDVVQLLARVSSSLAARIGDVDAIADDGRRARVRSAARHAVGLGAAAYAEAAAAPELANPNDASSYAQWLWARYQEAWAEVVDLVDAITPGDEPAGAAPVELGDGPAVIGGERFGWGGRGW